MRTRLRLGLGLVLLRLLLAPALEAAVIYQTQSEYNRIQVIDQGGFRILSFGGSMETRMSLRNPLEGEFSYIDLFHAPWIWRSDLTNVLMIGLGGGSIQRAFQHDYPEVYVDTVEIDPVVVAVAKKYFHVQESERHKTHVADGRKFLERTNKIYQAMLIDAYTSDPAGSSIPVQLASQEFFQLAARHLDSNGVLALNVMGTLGHRGPDLIGSIYNTLRTGFPTIYLFPALDSANVVLLAIRSDRFFPPAVIRRRAAELVASGRVKARGFSQAVWQVRTGPPPSAALSPVIHDHSPPRGGLSNSQLNR